MKKDPPEYLQILQSELAKRSARNAKYSLRRFAQSTKVPPSSLSLILAGKRVPSHEAATRLMDSLSLGRAARESFMGSLSETQRKRRLKRMNPMFRRSAPQAPVKSLDLDLFRLIADWHHNAILMLTQIEGFRPDSRWIASELGLSPLEAKLAIDRLLGAGLLKPSVEGGWKFSDEPLTTTTQSEVTSEALRLHQKQILEKAQAALEGVPLEARSQTGMTLAIDPKRIPAAKELIDEFTQKMSQLLESGARKKVYQLSVSLFPLQVMRKGDRDES